MTVMEWNDRLNLGVEALDSAHRKLFSIMRRMAKLHENPDNYKLLCEEGIKYFKNYTLQHFSEEEAYMRSIGYARYEIHKQLHDNLRDNTLPVLEKEVLETNYSVESVQHFMGICMAWLTQHIMNEDRAITGSVPATGPQLSSRPEDEIAALMHAASQIIHTTLGLEAETASTHYHGEPVGNMVFCRLIYQSEKGKPIRAYLGFEDSLILAAVSEMMGTRVPKVNKMALSCMRHLAQSVMSKLAQHFAYADSCRLQKENMITAEIAMKLFQNESPLASFLYRTKEGYLVFCVQA